MQYVFRQRLVAELSSQTNGCIHKLLICTTLSLQGHLSFSSTLATYSQLNIILLSVFIFKPLTYIPDFHFSYLLMQTFLTQWNHD